MILPKRLPRIAFLILVGLIFFLTLFNWSRRDGKTLQLGNIKAVEVPHRPPSIEIPAYCDAINISNIAFITKTGATEAKDKLPPQLSTCLKCVEDPLIFSDLDQTLGPYQVHDILSRVSSETMQGNPDFDIYRKQKQLASEGRDNEIRDLADLPIMTYDWRTRGKSAAWALDKYKFLHMIDRAWEYQPNKDWYVFVEADTYLSLPNLANFLSSQDPEQKLYLGNPVRMYEHPTILYFAHGGSGFILSGATVKDFSVTHAGLANQFDNRVRQSWFGDFVVADALDEVLHVKVTDVSPMLQGDSPANFPFGSDSWCTPAISSHHMTAEDFDAVFEYEKSNQFAGLLYRDLFAISFDGPFPSRKDDWDNSADDGKFEIPVTPSSVSDNPYESISLEDLQGPNSLFAACELGCMQQPDCLQFSFHTFEDDEKNRCYLSMSFRLGHEVDHEDLKPGQAIDSGWLSERIAKWVRDQDCSG